MGFHLTFLSVYVDAELNASKTLYGSVENTLWLIFGKLGAKVLYIVHLYFTFYRHGFQLQRNKCHDFLICCKTDYRPIRRSKHGRVRFDVVLHSIHHLSLFTVMILNYRISSRHNACSP